MLTRTKNKLYNVKIILLLLTTSLITGCSCQHEVKLNLHPLGSNLGLNRADIEKLGFELSTVDHGCCIYQKQMDSLRIYFLLDTSDDCKKIKLQGVEFPFDVFSFDSSEDSVKLIYGEYPMDIFNDSLKISAIISELGGEIISNKMGYADVFNRYDVRNLATGRVFSASVYYRTDSRKYLNIEFE